MHLTGEVGHLPFFGLVFKPSGLTSSLEVVSPYGKPSTFRSSLIERVEKAWVTPFESLTVEQVRLLVGQKRGLQWLALPVLEFVDRYRMLKRRSIPAMLAWPWYMLPTH